MKTEIKFLGDFKFYEAGVSNWFILIWGKHAQMQTPHF